MNTNNKWSIVIFCLALFCTLALPTAVMADEWDQATKLTFSESVEAPGLILPAGTYWFTLADNDSDRNVVQIWNADRAHLVTTILAIPDCRQNTPQKTIINFEESPSGQPDVLRAWFYPGHNFGEEFVYPKTRQATREAGRQASALDARRAGIKRCAHQASVSKDGKPQR